MRRLSRRRRSMPFTPVPLSRCERLAAFCGWPDAVRESCLLEMDFGGVGDAAVDGDFRSPAESMVRRLDACADGRRRVVRWDVRPRRFFLIGRLKAAGLESRVVFTHGGVIACARTVAGSCSVEQAFAEPAPIQGRRHAAILTLSYGFPLFSRPTMARVLMYSGKRS